MWLGINSLGALLLLTLPASADSCVFTLTKPFVLKSDAVEWTMQIGSSKTCTRGLKYGAVTISNVELTNPPQSGQVTLQGPGFSYTAKSDFEGQDEFTLKVTGTMVRMPGTSDIRITVSVVAK
jgi:hypothetical protein